MVGPSIIVGKTLVDRADTVAQRKKSFVIDRDVEPDAPFACNLDAEKIAP